MDHTRTRPPLLRTSGIREGHPRRYIAGVCAGIAEHLDLSVSVIRLCVIAMTLTSPFGICAYVALWILLPSGDPVQARAAYERKKSGRAAPNIAESHHAKSLRFNRTRALRVGLLILTLPLIVSVISIAGGIYFGAVPFLNSWPEKFFHTFEIARNIVGDNIIFALIIFVVCSVIGISFAWPAVAPESTVRFKKTKVIVGVIYIMIGCYCFVSFQRDNTWFSFFLFIAIMIFSFALALMPRIIDTREQLNESRKREIEEDARAEIAAHLHDSVLQTLSLIRTRADDAPTVAALARSQERELREWLYQSHDDKETSLAALIRAALADVEDKTGHDIELVTVGDVTPSPFTRPLVAIIHEAALNAVRHGKPPVSVYVEVNEKDIETHILDHGDGFDIDAIPPDRHGVKESIIARAQRLRGHVTIHTTSAGCDVSIHIPKEEYQ